MKRNQFLTRIGKYLGVAALAILLGGSVGKTYADSKLLVNVDETIVSPIVHEQPSTVEFGTMMKPELLVMQQNTLIAKQHNPVKRTAILESSETRNELPDQKSRRNAPLVTNFLLAIMPRGSDSELNTS